MSPSEKEERFLNILDGHRDQVYRMCWGFTSDPNDVQDLFQEVMLRIWKGLEGYRAEATLSTWIYRISINTCLLWKKGRKNKTFKLDFVSDSSTIDPMKDMEEDEQILLLRRAIQQLKKLDRSIMLLLLEECSYKEIGEITGLTSTNVGAKINRIKTKIKTFMEEN